MSISMDVVVTTHNDADFLREAILSIIYGAKNVDLVKRIVVVDDASRPAETDLVNEVISELTAYHSDIQLIRNSANCGLSHSRNRGLRLCDSEYVTFLDADDLKPAGWGEIVKNIIEEEYPEYIFTSSLLIDDRYNISQFYDFDISEKLFSNNIIKSFKKNERFFPLILEPQIGNKYFKREIITRYLFPIGRKFEDIYLIARMTLNLERVFGANVATHFYNATERSSRITMRPQLKNDIIGNLAGLSSIYTHHFDSRAEALRREYGKSDGLNDKEIKRQLNDLDIERQFAFAALKYSFARLLDWSINTLPISEIETFTDRMGRIFRSMSTNPSVAEVLGNIGDPRTLRWYDNLVHILTNGDSGYLGQIYA